MDNAKEQIKKWMKKNGKNRFWLADQFGIDKGTVDNWFKANGVIPKTKLALIQSLMNTESDDDATKSEKMEAYGIMFTEEEHCLVSEAAKSRGMTFGEFMRYAILNPDAK